MNLQGLGVASRSSGYAVVACQGCREAWAVELRHSQATCPRCATTADLARRVRLWQGESPQQAQAAAAALRGQGAPSGLPAPARVPRHDSPIDAAAAQGVGIRNQSERAEAVAAALTLLCGHASHQDLLEALSKAGLGAARAEAEVQRMLACDRLLEPRAGEYRWLQE